MIELPHSVGKYVTSFDNTRIYYNVLKAPQSTKNLVFLHGLGSDSAAWNVEREALAKKGYSSIALDIRGHGLSDRPRFEGAYVIDNFVEDLIVVLKHEELQKVILVGHCFGAMIAMKAEADYPTSSRALVLIDTSFKPPVFSPSLADHRLMNSIFSFITRHSPTLHKSGHVNTAKFYGTSDFSAKRILSDVLHTSLRSYLSVCEDIAHIDAKTLLKKITVPTLIVSGTDDLIFPPEVAEELHKRIAGSEVSYVDGGNHILVTNNPKDLIEDIDRFCRN